VFEIKYGGQKAKESAQYRTQLRFGGGNWGDEEQRQLQATPPNRLILLTIDDWHGEIAFRIPSFFRNVHYRTSDSFGSKSHKF